MTAITPFPTRAGRTVRPVGDRILVVPIEQIETTTLSLIPDVAREKPQLGRVVAVGPGVFSAIEAEHVVAYTKYSGHELTVDGTTYLVLGPADVLAVLEDPPAPDSTSP